MAEVTIGPNIDPFPINFTVKAQLNEPQTALRIDRQPGCNARLVSRVAKFAYEIFRDQELLATGFTKHVYVDRQMRRSRLPERYRELFGMEKSLPALIPPAAI